MTAEQAAVLRGLLAVITAQPVLPPYEPRTRAQRQINDALPDLLDQLETQAEEIERLQLVHEAAQAVFWQAFNMGDGDWPFGMGNQFEALRDALAALKDQDHE